MAKKITPSRRAFVLSAIAAGGTLVTSKDTKATTADDPAITEMQPWPP